MACRIANNGKPRRTVLLRALAAMLPGMSSAVAADIRRAAGTLPRVGVLINYSESDPQAKDSISSFLVGIRGAGWVLGKTLVVDFLFADGKPDRLSDLTARLVGLKPDVLVVSGSGAMQAARAATTKIPIVFSAVGDPIGAGFANSLARPGRNATGLSLMVVGLSGKRLELLRAALPDASRVGMLWNQTNQSHVAQVMETESAGRTMGIKVMPLDAATPEQLEAALERAADLKVEALIAISDVVQIAARHHIVEAANRHRIPVVSEFSEMVDAGAVFSYGPNRPDLWRRAAGFVDRILKGADASDLPIEQPVKIELVANVRAAAALGVRLPQAVLGLADRLVR